MREGMTELWECRRHFGTLRAVNKTLLPDVQRSVLDILKFLDALRVSGTLFGATSLFSTCSNPRADTVPRGSGRRYREQPTVEFAHEASPPALRRREGTHSAAMDLFPHQGLNPDVAYAVAKVMRKNGNSHVAAESLGSG